MTMFVIFFSALMGTNTELQFWGAMTMEALLTPGSPDFIGGCLVGCCLLVNAYLSLEISREWFVESENAERNSWKGYCNL